MFGKIANMLGKVKDFGSNLINASKHGVSSGWDAFKSGVSKVGKFINDNHESIGTILSGVGSIIGGLPNSDIKNKLSNYADGAGRANNFIHGGYGGIRRPSNTPRTQFSNNLTNKNEEGSPALTKQSAPPMNYNPEGRQFKVRHLI